MDRHLSDMREWYRRKLRELTERQRSGEGDKEAEENGGAMAGGEGDDAAQGGETHARAAGPALPSIRRGRPSSK